MKRPSYGGKADGAGTVQLRGETAERMDLVHEYKYRSAERMDQAVPTGAEQPDKRRWAEADAQKFHLNIRKNFFTVQKEIAQGGCGVSLTVDIPELSGHNPVPCVLG